MEPQRTWVESWRFTNAGAYGSSRPNASARGFLRAPGRRCMAVKLGGKKGEKYNLGQNADINVTPFVDVMLVLLIIFMVAIPPPGVVVTRGLPALGARAPRP